MALTSAEVAQICKEVILGKEPTLDSPEALVMRKELEGDKRRAEKAGALEAPFGIPETEEMSLSDRFRLIESIKGKYKRLMSSEEFMAEKRKDALLED